MRKRNVDKHIWFDRPEAQDWQKKAKKACLTEAALIRLLIRCLLYTSCWQLVEGKQKFASQIMTSKSPVRSCEDAVSYTHLDVYKRQMKASARSLRASGRQTTTWSRSRNLFPKRKLPNGFMATDE